MAPSACREGRPVGSTSGAVPVHGAGGKCHHHLGWGLKLLFPEASEPGSAPRAPTESHCALPPASWAIFTPEEAARILDEPMPPPDLGEARRASSGATFTRASSHLPVRRVPNAVPALPISSAPTGPFPERSWFHYTGSTRSRSAAPAGSRDKVPRRHSTPTASTEDVGRTQSKMPRCPQVTVDAPASSCPPGTPGLPQNGNKQESVCHPGICTPGTGHTGEAAS